MRKGIVCLTSAAMLLWGASSIYAQRSFGRGGGAAATSTVTNVTGTISQLNYGDGGNVQGFLIGTNVLLEFPGNVSGGVASLGAVGNSVTYSGTALTPSSGFESVRVSSFTNNVTHASYTTPTTSSAAYGPVSGTIKQLNYQANGGADGFLFEASGTSAPVLVILGRLPVSSTLASLLVVGATVSVTGTGRTSSAASSTALTVVRPSALSVGGQNFVIGSGGRPSGPGRGAGRF